MAWTLRVAGALSVLAGLVWPIQAAALAWAISGWVSGDADRRALAALIFVLGGALCALLDHRAGAYPYDVANRTVTRERSALIEREARARAGAGSAALAAMIGAAVILADPIFQGLAISLLFGLASSTMLTVLVIPAIYVALRGGSRGATA